jgi:membrane-bound lytic murein transglycosylase F
MGPTWADVSKSLAYPSGSTRFDAKLAIEAGAFYQGRLRRSWSAVGRTDVARNELGQASYNAGMGNILKAQKLCKGVRLWPDISPCLVSVTGKQFSRETITYVSRIRVYWQQMEVSP